MRRVCQAVGATLTQDLLVRVAFLAASLTSFYNAARRFGDGDPDHGLFWIIAGVCFACCGAWVGDGDAQDDDFEP